MPPASAGPSRRRVLALALAAPAALLGGCGVDWGAIRRDDGTPPPAAEPDADELARRRAVRDATVLGDAAGAAAAQVAASGTAEVAAALLATLGEVCRQHLAALAPAGGATPWSGATPGSSGPGSAASTAAPSTAAPSGATTPPGAATPPGTAGATAPAAAAPPVAPAEVVDLLAETTATALADAMTASPVMARLLVSVAAARAVLADRLAVALGVPAPPVPVVETGAADPVTPVPDGAPGSAPATTAAPPPSTPPSDAGPGSLTAALAASVEAERAAAYAYGVLGSQLADAARRSALVTLEEHRGRAGVLLAIAEEVGADLPPGAPAWELPAPVTTPEQALALAVRVERRVTAVHLDLVGVSAPPLRATAAGLVVGSALRAAGWGGDPTAFPGRA